jgi:choice-of-anchor C domain-containing protein
MSATHVRRRRTLLGTGMLGAVIGLAISAAGPAAGAAPQPQRFSDGSFEQPVVAPGTAQRIPAGADIGSWTVTRGDVDLSGEGYWQTADGNQSLDLDGSVQGSVAQSFTTVPLVTYEVSFALAGNPVAAPAVKTGQVLVNGLVAQSFSFDTTGKTETNMGYVQRRFIFLATSTSTTLAFSSTTTPAGYGPVIDNVKVESCLIILCH